MAPALLARVSLVLLLTAPVLGQGEETPGSGVAAGSRRGRGGAGAGSGVPRAPGGPAWSERISRIPGRGAARTP